MTPTTHSKSSRGQAAVEVLVYIGFFLLIFVVLNIFFVIQVSSDIKQRQYTLAQQTAGEISDDLQLALLAGPGFSGTFRLPERINGQAYIGRFYRSSLYIDVAAPSVPGVSDSSGYGLRLYYPLGTSNVGLACDPAVSATTGLPTNPACSGQYIGSGADSYLQYNFTQAQGRLAVQNTYDSTGQPQLRIMAVQ